MMTGDVELHKPSPFAVFRPGLHLLQTCPLALVGGGDAHRLTVLGDRATCDRYPFAGQKLGETAVTKWALRVLLLDEFLDLGAYGGRGGAGSVSPLDLAGKEIAELEHPPRGVHVLARGHARDGRLVHAHGCGNVLQDHRPHVLVPMLEERLLPLDDRAGDLDEGLMADLEALQKPARLLQLRPHGGVARVAPDEARVTII